MIVPRLLSEVSLGRSDDEEKRPAPLESHFQDSVIVVLGDPGAGKTTLFREVSKLEGGRFYEVRRFLRGSISMTGGEPLYLDGLDEVRAQDRDGRMVIDRLITKLEELGKPKVRLSCRATDWFGNLDESHLRDASQSGEVRVLRLCPLSESDAEAIARAFGEDADEFMRQAAKRGFLDWLQNPQHLLLLLKALAGNGWPESKYELFQRACYTLVREQNQEHIAAATEDFAPDDLVNAAGFLCAVILVAGTVGVALDQPHEDENFPWVGSLSHPRVDRRAVKRALGLGLFRQDALGRQVPMHRSVAEFVAGRFIAKLCREQGLSWNRIVRMLTAQDGGVPSELRGLWAWLVSALPERSTTVVDRDPRGLIEYGDSSRLPAQARRVLLSALLQEASRDPFFRLDYSARGALAHLATEDLKNDLKLLLERSDAPWQLKVTIFDGIAEAGQELFGDFGDLLLRLARDASVPAVAIRAMRAFSRVCPTRAEDMRSLLQAVQQGAIEDPGDQIRTILTETLWPNDLTASELVDLIPTPRTGTASSFLHYLLSRFPDRVSECHLTGLLDSFAAWEPPEDKDTFSHRTAVEYLGSLLSRVLVRGLVAFGDEVDASRLAGWLSIHLDRRFSLGRSVLTQEEAKSIEDWLRARPKRLRAVYLATFGGADAKSLRQVRWRTAAMCCHLKPPDLADVLLELARATDDPELAGVLLIEAVREGWDGAIFEEGLKMASERPELLVNLEPVLSCDLAAHRDMDPGHQGRDEEFRRAMAEQKEKSLRWLLDNKCALAAGEARQALESLAYEFYDLGVDEDLSGLDPAERLQHRWGHEVASAAHRGFIQLVCSAAQRDLSATGKLSTKSKVPRWVQAFHAGLDLLWLEDPGKVLRLPPKTLGVAVVSHLAGAFGKDEAKSEWPSEVAELHPEACSDALEEYWRPQLSRAKNSVIGLAWLRKWGKIRAKLSPQLLENFPRAHPDAIREVIAANLLDGRRDHVLQIVRAQLTNPRGLAAEQFLVWLAAGFLLAPDEFGQKLQTHAGRPVRGAGSGKRAALLREYISQFRRTGTDLVGELGPSYLETIAVAFTAAYPHPPLGSSGAVTAEWEVPSFVGEVIELIAASAAQDAELVLQRLIRRRGMTPWQDYLRRALLNHDRNRRESLFTRPSVAEVQDILGGKAPSGAADLHAVVCDYMEAIADDIRNGDTDGYRIFWNQASQWKVADPLPEAVCRDRLSERLKIELRHLGISIEREASVAEYKRADLRIVKGSVAIPLECKRQDNLYLWSAIDQQLVQYTRDPASSGFGVYCVFWFGDDISGVPAAPGGTEKPRDARELCGTLRSISRKHGDRIAVFCIDVSRPIARKGRGRTGQP